MEAEREPVVARGERVLELVPVAVLGARRDDRLERRLREPAEADQRVTHLGVLRLELALVGVVLEAAAAARPEVAARRLDPVGPRLEQRGAHGLGEAALDLRRARAHEVAGQPAADEDDEAVESGDAVPAVGERVDAELDLLPLAHRCGHRGSLPASPCGSIGTLLRVSLTAIPDSSRWQQSLAATPGSVRWQVVGDSSLRVRPRQPVVERAASRRRRGATKHGRGASTRPTDAGTPAGCSVVPPEAGAPPDDVRSDRWRHPSSAPTRLTKHYGTTVGVSGLSFTVEPGEVFGYLGPNGAGKTTTIRLLLDLIRPTSGRVEVFGLDARRDAVEVRRRVGLPPRRPAAVRAADRPRARPLPRRPARDARPR